MRIVDTASLAGLTDLSEPPTVLYSQGELPARPAVAIVGTRRADPFAAAFAHELARSAARAGVWVISGGADGIDAAAHRGALDGGGGTLVVQAAALDAPYPRTQRPLYDAILAAGGGWLSETPPGQPARAWRFLARNRIIAALADAVVVVQAPLRSGALSTARHARELGRALYAVPGAPWDPSFEGGVALLRGDASICLGWRDLEPHLGAAPTETAEAARGPALEGDERVVYDALRVRGQHADELSSALGIDSARLRAALVRLQLRELAVEDLYGWRKAPRR
ncbi:MAG: DNA-processing protein DprA [Sandaracinaceae bacterium]